MFCFLSDEAADDHEELMAAATAALDTGINPLI